MNEAKRITYVQSLLSQLSAVNQTLAGMDYTDPMTDVWREVKADLQHRLYLNRLTW